MTFCKNESDIISVQRSMRKEVFSRKPMSFFFFFYLVLDIRD